LVAVEDDRPDNEGGAADELEVQDEPEHEYWKKNEMRTEFERMINIGLYSKEQIFSFEMNFERTTDTFWKNVIRSNDLSRNRNVPDIVVFPKYVKYSSMKWKD
jgi:hypothetical protein